MSSLRSGTSRCGCIRASRSDSVSPFTGMPTPTLTENWDDDFDFDSALPAPSTSSSRTTSSSHPRLPRTLQGSEEDGLSGIQQERRGIQPRVVESWDDDFDYEPSDMNNNFKAMTEQNAHLERMVPPTLSPALKSMESATSLRTATVPAHRQPSQQRSNNSMSSHSTVQSSRRNRKRSSEFPLHATRSSLNIERSQLVASDTTSSIGKGHGKGLNKEAMRRTTDASTGASRKSSKYELSSHGAKEGSFMGRVTSIRRHISGSLSTGSSAISLDRKSAASDAMPPPPVPLSAFRSSSHVNRLPTLGTVVPDLPRVSFDDSRKLEKQRKLAPGLQKRPVRQQSDLVSGLPLTGNTRVSIDTMSPSHSMGDIATSDSGSTALHSTECNTGISTESRAISPTSQPGRYPSSSFSSPSPSLASLASHAGSYGFHLPSPAAGSAYNMFNAAFGESAPQRQVSDSSATSRRLLAPSNSARSVSLTKDDSFDMDKKRGSPNLESTRGAYREGSSEHSAARTTANVQSAALSDQRNSTPASREVKAGLASLDGMNRPDFAPVVDESGSASRGSDAPSPDSDYKNSQTLSVYPEESSMGTFRFGAIPPSASLQSVLALAVSPRPGGVVSGEPSSTPIKDRPAGKARLTLRRIGSISRRHSRKISDGWRAVSGHSTSPAKTLPAAGPSVVRNPVPRQVGPNASRPPMLSAQNLLPHPSSSLQSGTTRLAGSPVVETFGRGTSTPPRNTMLSTSRPLSMVQPGTSPSGTVPVTLRSLSQNDSPSTTKIGSTTAQTVHTVPGGLRPDMYSRRNSLGDLKIPSRVVSAQKGLKEEIGAMKQFAAGVQGKRLLSRSAFS